MRLSIIATPMQPEAAIASASRNEGTQARDWLAREETGFDVVQADPGQDLAEQLEAVLTSRSVGPSDAVLLHAACPVLLSVDGELFLCFDPEQPLVGDALADIAAVLRERAEGPKLLVIDGVEARASLDPHRAASIGRAAEAAVDPPGSGIELIVMVRSHDAQGEAQASTFVEAARAALDALPRGTGLTAEEVFARASAQGGAGAPFMLHSPVSKGKSFALVPGASPHEESHDEVAAPREEDITTSIPRPPPVPRKTADTLPSFPENVEFSWSEDDLSWADPTAHSSVTRPLAAPPGASLPPPPMPSAHETPPPSSPISGPISSPISGREISLFARYAIEGEVLAAQGENEGAIGEFRKALAVLGPTGDPEARAEMYVRIGDLRRKRGDVDSAIADFEKALALRPRHRVALEALIALCAQEQDWRGLLSAEERLLLALPEEVRFERMVQFGVLWEEVIDKPARAKLLYERALDIRPNDPAARGRLRGLMNKLSAKGSRREST
jgi:hypothetical protein